MRGAPLAVLLAPSVALAHGLHVPLDGDEMRGGVMFDLEAEIDVEITGFSVHLATTTLETFDVWTREGSWQGHASAEQGWTRVGRVNAYGAGWGFQTFLPLPLDVHVPAGGVRAFYLEQTTGGRLLLTRGGQVGEPRAAQPGVFTVEIGAAVDGHFGTVTTPRSFNGGIEFTGEPNRAPYATVPVVETPVDTPIAIPLTGHDPDGDPVVALPGAAARGTLAPDVPGVWVYTPPLGFVGTDTFPFRVTDGALASDEVWVDVVVARADNRLPTAAIGPVSGAREGTPTTVDGSGSHDLDGHVVEWRWDCDGDGVEEIARATPTATCTWLDDGVFALGLVVVDDRGGVARASRRVTVENVPPRVFLAGATAGAVGAPLAFTASALDAADAEVALRWTFGDGRTAVGAAVEHAWVAAGRYEVVVTADDGDGGTATASTTVSVGP